jgi:hypothetical protein
LPIALIAVALTATVLVMRKKRVGPWKLRKRWKTKE